MEDGPSLLKPEGIARYPNSHRRDSENTDSVRGGTNVPAVTLLFLSHLPLGQSHLHLN